MTLILSTHCFTERMNDADGLEPVPCQPWTSRLPKMAQPDLDYIGKYNKYK